MIVTEVAKEIDEFLNHGLTYLVYYKIAQVGTQSTFRAFTTKNKTEAILKHEQLKHQVIENMKSLITF